MCIRDRSSYFAGDFFLGHFLLYMQTPLLFFPFVDYFHSMTLLWLNPTQLVSHKRIFTKKQKRRRNIIIAKYILLYFMLLLNLLFLFIAPFFADELIPEPQSLVLNTPLNRTVQPYKHDNNDTGPFVAPTDPAMGQTVKYITI